MRFQKAGKKSTLGVPVLRAEYTAPWASKFWVAHMIVKTLASACLLLEIRWQKGRQADKISPCTHSLPTLLAPPSNFLSLPSTEFLKNKFCCSCCSCYWQETSLQTNP